MNKLHHTILPLLLSCVACAALGQSAGSNYVLHRVLCDSATATYRVEVGYVDGLGRPTMQVAHGCDGTGGYVGTLREYDSRGLPCAAWQPVPLGGGPEEVAREAYSGMAADFHQDAAPYTSTTYDILGRVTSTTIPGQAWHGGGHARTTEYRCNAEGEVRRYAAPCDGTNSLADEGCYAQGTLRVAIHTDEDGHTLAVYTDRQGRTVMERRGADHDTYYVYDAMGRLRFVLSPKFQEEADVDALAYEYRYDGWGRQVWKRLPGCGPRLRGYDEHGRVRWESDSLLRAGGRYRFFLYDALGRLCVQGTGTGSPPATGATSQVSFTPILSGVCGSLYTQSMGSTVVPADARLERACYYDNYTFLTSLMGVLGPHLQSAHHAAFRHAGTPQNARSLPTGIAERTSDGMLRCSVCYYDDRARLCDTRGETASGDLLRVATEHTFAGLPSTVETTLQRSDTTWAVTAQNDYDIRCGLPTGTTLATGNATIAAATRSYDATGRLGALQLGGTASQGYAYDVRGWLRRITGSCFSEELDYEDYYQQPLYSGNVAKVGWTDGQKPHADSYLLNYDAYGRLTAARYDEGGSEAGDFDEELAYDANGGVTALRRRAIDCEYGTYYYKKTCDSLVVTRQGNQLKRVVDYGSNLYATGYFEFEANASTPPTTTYAYNANGSLEQDWHRGLTLAQYDDAGNLHRVQFTNGAVTRYVRGLGGDLQAMIQQTAVRRTRVQMGDTLELTTARLLATDTTWHAGPFVYTSAGKVSYRHGDGYVELAATPADTATAYYYLRDHVGSVRAVVRGDGTLVQRTAYYPFGGMHGRWSQGDGVQPLKHGGQELDRMHGKDWYLYQARAYMPVLGEFTQVDEHCEDYYHLSPYAFCADNPSNNIDPDGKVVIPVHGTWANPNTWENLDDIMEATTNLFGDNHKGIPFRWNGGNNNYSERRTRAAISLIGDVREQLGNYPKDEPVTLVGHSHGGNVIIEAVNRMVKMEEFKDVKINVLTINTPVRSDYQLSDEAVKRVDHVNVYDPKDPVQRFGGNMNHPENPYYGLWHALNANLDMLVGEYGLAGRTFKNARNIEVDHPQGMFGDFHNSHNRVQDWINKTKNKSK